MRIYILGYVDRKIHNIKIYYDVNTITLYKLSLVVHHLLVNVFKFVHINPDCQNWSQEMSAKASVAWQRLLISFTRKRLTASKTFA